MYMEHDFCVAPCRTILCYVCTQLGLTLTVVAKNDVLCKYPLCILGKQPMMNRSNSTDINYNFLDFIAPMPNN
jgi:hypothetical protein